MADIQEPTAVIEPEAPTIETEVEAEVAETEPQAESEQPEAGDLPNPDEDLEEFDWNGKTIKGPKGLKDGLMLQADYTRKTQEIAQTRRELDERKARIDQQFQASEQELAARGTLAVLKGQLNEYANVNWDQLEANDPIAAQQHFRRYQVLKDQVSSLTADLSAVEQQRTQESQREVAKRFEQTQEFARKEIPGWTPETDAQVLAWAKENGATDQDLISAMSPLVYKLLYLARIGDQATKKTAVPKPASIVKPLPTVGGKTNPSAVKPLGEMSMDEYAAYRQKQMARR